MYDKEMLVPIFEIKFFALITRLGIAELVRDGCGCRIFILALTLNIIIIIGPKNSGKKNGK